MPPWHVSATRVQHVRPPDHRRSHRPTWCAWRPLAPAFAHAPPLAPRRQGVSLSSLIEAALREMADEYDAPSFVERWRGSMVLAERDDDRYKALREKYG